MMSHHDGSWTATMIGSQGEAVSSDFPAIYLPNDDLAMALISDDGQNQNLSVWMYNGTNLTRVPSQASPTFPVKSISP